MDEEGFRVDRELSTMITSMDAEELLAFRELHQQQQPWEDSQLELDILILVVLGGKLRSAPESRAALDEAVQRAESWAAKQGLERLEQQRRMRVLDNVLALQLQLNQREPTSSQVLDPVGRRPDLIPRLRNMLDAPQGGFTLDQDTIGLTGEELQRVIEMLPANDPRLPMVATALACTMLLLYQDSPTPEQVKLLVDTARQAVRVTPPNHASRSRALDVLGRALFYQWKQSHNIDDLESAIDALKNALSFEVHGPAWRGLASTLSDALLRHYSLTGHDHDFEQGVQICNMLIAAQPPKDPGFEDTFNTLTFFLVERAGRSGTPSDLNAVIEKLEYGIRYTKDRAHLLEGLSRGLELRYQDTGLEEDINRSVSLIEESLACTSMEDERFLDRLWLLSTNLSVRYGGFGAVEDIEQALEWAELSEYAPNITDDQRANAKRQIGDILIARFQGLRQYGDLNRAMTLFYEALEVTAGDGRTSSGISESISRGLAIRASYTSSQEDLKLSAAFSEKAAASAIPGDKPKALYQLAAQYLTLYMRTPDDIMQLLKAIKILEEVRDSTAGEHVIANALALLGECWRFRFEHSQLRQDLDTAIEYHEIVRQMTPEDERELPHRLSLFARAYKDLYKATDNVEMLSRAIDLIEESLSLPTRESSLRRADALRSLGDWRWKRYQLEKRPEDEARALECFLQIWNDKSARPLDRIHAAAGASDLLSSQQSWEEVYELLKQSVELLPLLNPLSLSNADKQYVLERCSGLASNAAAAALFANKSPEEALSMVELGRGLISGLLLDVRTDISALREKRPDLAARFEAARNNLEASIPNYLGLEQFEESLIPRIARVRRSHEAEQTFKQVCSDLRNEKGFERFQLSPTTDELIAAANQGPIVVVNVSLWRCDALIVQEHCIQSIPLPTLDAQTAMEKRRLLSHHTVDGMLEYLWDAVACPILQALGFQETPPLPENSWPRIWWITTGALTTLPIHAAGYHRHGSNMAVIDRVVSSYSSSIKTIIHHRRSCQHIPVRNQISSESSTEELGQALLVSMPYTPHNPGEEAISLLPFAQQEITEVAKALTRLNLSANTSHKKKAACLAVIKYCRVFHFAGHGKLDPYDPAGSALLLEDWRTDLLTVANLRDLRLQDHAPFLAYLSACSTGAALNMRLLDENIHLISGFQIAGFRHVIGTLWEVADEYCVDVAKAFYEAIHEEGGLLDGAVSLALHRAIRKLRDSARVVEESPVSSENGISSISSKFKRHDEEMLADIQLPQQKVVDRSLRDARYKGGQKSELNPMYWAPYMHFGL